MPYLEEKSKEHSATEGHGASGEGMDGKAGGDSYMTLSPSLSERSFRDRLNDTAECLENSLHDYPVANSIYKLV